MTTAGAYVSEREVLGLLLSTNWEHPIAWPNMAFDPPAKTGSRTSPAEWTNFDIETTSGGSRTLGGNRNIAGAVLLTHAIEPGVGDLLLRQRVESLAAIFEAAATSSFYFYPEEPDSFLDDSGEWFKCNLDIPFSRTVDPEAPLTLFGQGSNQASIVATSHSFAVGDQAGIDGSGELVKAQATAGGTASEGTISRVIDADTVELTAAGVLTITGHGWPVGARYLSPTVAGGSTATVPGDDYQQVLTVLDANRVIVRPSLRLT